MAEANRESPRNDRSYKDMITRVRVTIITHDDKRLERETTPMQIETLKGDILQWMYEDMCEEELRNRTQPTERSQ